MEEEEFAGFAVAGIVDRHGHGAVTETAPGISRRVIVRIEILAIVDEHIGPADKIEGLAGKSLGGLHIGGIDQALLPITQPVDQYTG